MDFFDMLASTPPRGKKRKIEHGESPQLAPDMKKCEMAHSTDVKNDVKNHGCRAGSKRKQCPWSMPLEERLKKWGLDEEFTVLGGARLGCITCMKYDTWCEQEGAYNSKRTYYRKKKETEKSHGLAEADSGDEETTRRNRDLCKGTYEPLQLKRLKEVLERHLKRPQHKKAAAARDEEEQTCQEDVPSAAQMMFAYDGVKKSPMVPPLPPLPRGSYGLIAFRFVSDTQSHHN